MSLIRKRYYIWLLKAYLRRWSKTILSSLIFGVIFFFAIIFIINFYFLPRVQKKVQKIGYWGTYRTDTLPHEILSDISYGLTKLNPDGTVAPAASYSWQIKNDGKEYVFKIKKGQYFHNNKELTSESLNLNFKDVQKGIIDNYTVSIFLKEPYSPFLVTVSKPILAQNFSGLGIFKVAKVELNGGFVKKITLQNKNDPSNKKIINFYPTEEALKTAFALGEIDVAQELTDLKIKGSDAALWTNTHIEKRVDYSRLFTIFYNNADSIVSNKKVRQALSFAIPDKFDEGERAYSPISPKSAFFAKTPNYGISDLDIAKSLISSEKEIKNKSFEISVDEENKDLAEKIAYYWNKIGVKTKIKVQSGIPGSFQILIYPIKLPHDPDQYTLWHSGQANNISKYNSMRIDKLLEDGRSISDLEKRISIYSDFQKYLIDDSPATFVYFPYVYTLSRK